MPRKLSHTRCLNAALADGLVVEVDLLLSPPIDAGEQNGKGGF